jgi:hypothetical protein
MRILFFLIIYNGIQVDMEKQYAITMRLPAR